MQFLGVTSAGFFAGQSEAERDFQRRVWESQRAVTGEGIENPFEIFRQRGEYIDRTQNGGGLEPWEFGYTEPETETQPGWWPDWLPDLSPFDEAYRRGQGSLGSVPLDPDRGGGLINRGGLFGIEWGSFLLRTIYVVLGIILLGIGAAALASQAGNNPLSRTLRDAQRFVS